MSASTHVIPPPGGESVRRFLAAPFHASPEEPPPATRRRRIWEVDAGALFVVLGVLLDRGELEEVFRKVAQEEHRSTRDDALLLGVVTRCARAGPFAEAVERELDRRTSLRATPRGRV